MIVNNATLEGLRTTFSKLFQAGIKSATSRWQRVAMRVPSGSKNNTYGWLQRAPQMREWASGTKRMLRGVVEKLYQLPNKKWETTIDVEREDIEDDNLGVYTPLVMMAGQETMDHVDRHVFDTLRLAHAITCYDGQSYFSTAHPLAANVDGTGASRNVSNMLLGAPTAAKRTAGATAADAVSTAGTVTGYAKYKVRFTTAGAIGAAKFKLSINGGDEGDEIATAAAGYAIPGTGIAIKFKAGTEFVVEDAWEFEGRSPWFLLHTMAAVKPLIYQDRMAPEIESITNTQQDTVFMEDKFLIGARARRAFGVGFWQMAAMSTRELNEDNFDELFQVVQEQCWDGGDPCGFTPDMLVCGPALRSASNQTIKQQYGANGESNPNYQAVDVECTPWLKR